MSEAKFVRNAAIQGSTVCSYGVEVTLESNSSVLLSEMESLARKALLGNLEIIEKRHLRHSIGLFERADGSVEIITDGKAEGSIATAESAKELFVRLLRLKISEFAEGFTFIHAGVVGWKGKAIILPGHSGKGKTTLVIELVKRGALYYSDEYAVLDENGFVHPFARELSVRAPGRDWSEKDGIPVESFGGRAGSEPIPAGLVLLTEYEDEGKWGPEILSAGTGIMEVIVHTIPLRANPEFSLNVLKKALCRAIIARTPRGDAAEAAENILSLIE